MVDLVSNLQALVDSDRFLANLDVAAIDDILDARDSDPFDAEWGRVFQLVAQHQPTGSTTVDALRESAFKRAFAITESPDACGYISDDFGLIADATRVEVADLWLAALTASYTAGALPHGELTKDSRSLLEILSEFSS